jgi:hypothetical protein
VHPAFLQELVAVRRIPAHKSKTLFFINKKLKVVANIDKEINLRHICRKLILD